jgi:hypothetical protein
MRDAKMRREAWRWAEREIERWVSDGEGRKQVKESDEREEKRERERERSMQRAYMREIMGKRKRDGGQK